MGKEEKSTLTKVSVFVRSIHTNPWGGVTVVASNGGLEGPPYVRFNLPPVRVKDCHIDKRYMLTIEEV